MATLLDPRPQLVLPFGNARPFSPRGTIARSQFVQLQKNRNLISSDEVINLKKQKQMLLKERSILIAKIARYESQPYQRTNDSQNKKIADSVDRDVKKLKHVIEEKRKDLEAVSHSDTAFSILETQEESKILHLELVRLKDEKERLQKALASSEKKLDALIEEYSPIKLLMMEKDLQEQKKKVTAKMNAVDKLEFPEKYNPTLKNFQEKEEEEEKLRQELLNKIKESEKQIKQERSLIAKYEQELQE